ncbi:GCD14-domain-containing protein [Tilletiaria anomala UBC 951]|uniref:tRNA (adenine(58)-N(1))-methyltransferase catalytic subunit TRM61 n=1 Tax=Tilletiaria anomala (strain ATCC 24038 / CBS 436.72 / UBC 951) TaxID=1037660 RepID=A0A066VYF7_TILAU|nr:GCD14-domain-containing protein [Tilletiaria anomala UBC 951]KDN45313.1 GCD14-domain-containing protein [Tilletiaria anomala UBC 951]
MSEQAAQAMADVRTSSKGQPDSLPMLESPHTALSQSALINPAQVQMDADGEEAAESVEAEKGQYEDVTGGAKTVYGVAKAHKHIEPGDLVVLFISRHTTPVPITVTPGEQFINTFGAFPHSSMVGRSFGSRLTTRNGKGFIHLLRPTPSLWTLALPHRTQILYLPDISFIISRLGLSPGAKVIEAGTGSGSMTHALARAVGTGRQHAKRWRGVEGMGTSAGRSARTSQSQGRDGSQCLLAKNGRNGGSDKEEREGDAGVTPALDLTLEEAGGPLAQGEGRVWSFEFHSERAKKASREFEAHGLCPNIVAINHRNVCKSGFGLPPSMSADAIFLDLPAPWEAIPFARRALRSDVATQVCTFSPCVEQVLRTVQAFNEQGFSDVHTFESLTRDHEVFTNFMGPLRSINAAVDRIKQIERNKELKRQDQIARSEVKRNKRAAAGGTIEEAAPAPAKRMRQEISGTDDEVMDDSEGVQELAPPTSSDQVGRNGKLELGEPTSNLEDCTAADDGEEVAIVPSGSKISIGSVKLQSGNVLTRPAGEMRGHTSYLTFATLKPQMLAQRH